MSSRFRYPSPFTLHVTAMVLAFGIVVQPVWPQDVHPSPTPSAQAPLLFTRTCTLCHGADAQGTDRAPTLLNSARLRSMTDSEIADVIRKGKDKMPAFPFPGAQIDELLRYIRFLSPAESATALAGDAEAGR
jgi:mono/diheme cytochrome c family protein